MGCRGDFLSVYNSRGVVIKYRDINENDKLLWIFSEKFGKISVMAKGAKKNKSKLMPASLTFCYGNYTLFKGKSMFSLNEGDIISSFQVFLEDLDSLSYASYLCELIDISMVEGESNRELFKEFVTAFYLMKNHVGDMETLIRAFEIKLLSATGFGLNMDCGRKISATAFKTLSYLSKITLDKVYRVKLNEEVKQEIYLVLEELIAQSYGKKPKSLEILYSLKRSE